MTESTVIGRPSGWATMSSKERFGYEKSLDQYSREELKNEVIFHFHRASSFERQKEYWRKEAQEISALLYKAEHSGGD